MFQTPKSAQFMAFEIRKVLTLHVIQCGKCDVIGQYLCEIGNEFEQIWCGETTGRMQGTYSWKNRRPILLVLTIGGKFLTSNKILNITLFRNDPRVVWSHPTDSPIRPYHRYTYQLVKKYLFIWYWLIGIACLTFVEAVFREGNWIGQWESRVFRLSQKNQLFSASISCAEYRLSWLVYITLLICS